MKTADARTAYQLAGLLADEFSLRLPSSFLLAHDEMVNALLPLAARLVIADRKARRNKKHAKAYRRVRREVRDHVAAMAMALSTPAPLAAAEGAPALDGGA